MVFDVVLEGRKAVSGLEPLAAGFATAMTTETDVAAEDGLLESEFVHGKDYPVVCAIGGTS